MEIDLEAFAERLKKLRIGRNLTVVQVSNRAMVPQPSLSQWENARNWPGAVNLYRLAKFYGVSVDFLLGLEE